MSKARLIAIGSVVFSLFNLTVFLPSHAATTTATMTLLKKLSVAPEHTFGYNRNLFKHWIDSDNDGCNTRKEVLLVEAVVKPKEYSSCTLTGGRWKSTYDNKIFTSFSALDIDHMVPLSEAWQSGAYRWDSKTRESYANDLGFSRSLIAVSATTNRAKGDQDPYLWMPPNRSYWCQYVNDWIAVKYRWGLTVDPAEKRDLVRRVSACGKQAKTLLPVKASRHFISSSSQSSSSSGVNSNQQHGHSGLDPRFSSCSKAKVAGYGPYYKGKDTECSWYRDGDGDGIACE